MYQWQRTHIIDELERHNCHVEVINPLMYSSTEEANNILMKRIDCGGIDLFFTNICYYKMLYIDTIEYIKKKGIPTLVIRCDNLVIPYNDRVLAPYFDLVWLTSKETKHIYDRWGVKSFFAPYAANPYTFRFTEELLNRKACFIGTPYGSRSIMINHLTTNKIPVDLFYGGKLSNTFTDYSSEIKSEIILPSRMTVLLNRLRFKEGRKLIKGKIVNTIVGQSDIDTNDYLERFPSMLPSEMSSCYSRYVLSLASSSTNHTDILKSPLKIINLRNFEIPMSGGIELCRYNEELAEYFEDGKEIVLYETDDELVDKAEYYIYKATEKEIFNMKKAARFRAENEHTWWNRFCIAFDILGLKY